MKNKKLFASCALVLSSILTVACGNGTSSMSSSSSDSSSSTSTSSYDSTSSNSSNSLPAINLDDKDLYYLVGTFYGVNGTLVINSKKATLESSSTSLSLTPTSVKDESIDETTTLALYFDEAYNNGTEYRAYVDLEGDGFLHLETKVDNEYVTYGTYQPDIAKYQGLYSSYGDSDVNNIYYVITNEFDNARNGFTTDHVSGIYWSNEQSYLGQTRIRGSKDNYYITYEEYDSDGDGWGESQLIMEENSVRFYDPLYEYDNSVTDFGLIQCVEVFDGSEVISITADLEEGILYWGEKEGTLSIAKDDNGFYVGTTLDNKDAKIRFHHHYITFEVGTEVSVYPINDTSEMVGTFTDKVNTIAYTYDEDSEVYSLEFNGEIVTFDYAIYNNRKAISFVNDNKKYIVTPEKSETAIKVSVDSKDSYYLNDEAFKELFANEYLIHDDNLTSTFSINSSLEYTIGSEVGQATYVYSHGDLEPYIKLGTKELHIANPLIGLYLYKDRDSSYLAYTSSSLDKVYGTYSSNGVDTLKVDASHVTIGDKTYEYSFTTYVTNGFSQFALKLKGTDSLVAFNLAGTAVLVEDDVEAKYYVTKDIFETIAGTYSAYGTYGIENIKITADGKLTLDTTNADKTGLDRDVEYPYYIITQEDSEFIAQIIFTYKNTPIALNVYSDHVSIGTLNYYDNTLVKSWGVYCDEDMNNIIYINNSDLYVNGTSVSYTNVSEDESTITYTTSTGSLVITKGDTYTAVYTDGETTTNLTRILDYSDYSKFNGTYTINESTLVFGKDSTGLSYQAVIGESTSVALKDMSFSIKDGGICLEISTFEGNYYLNLNVTTSEVTTSFEASSIPTPPPFPGL